MSSLRERTAANSLVVCAVAQPPREWGNDEQHRRDDHYVDRSHERVIHVRRHQHTNPYKPFASAVATPRLPAIRPGLRHHVASPDAVAFVWTIDGRKPGPISGRRVSTITLQGIGGSSGATGDSAGGAESPVARIFGCGLAPAGYLFAGWPSF